MIILVGPDGTGKSTLAERLQLPVNHFVRESTYNDYLAPLCSLELTSAVLDRHAICEYAYHLTMNRSFKFSTKEWHNLILLTLIQRPLIILCTHKPEREDYPSDQYLPYDKWDLCLGLYKAFFRVNHIPYIEYDYAGRIRPAALKILHDKHLHDMDWWQEMWRSGWGCIGSPFPKVLLVAERIGPNNVNNLPFETGPTGAMLTIMLQLTHTPLYDFAVTNMVKSWRKDTRGVVVADQELLETELRKLRPKMVVFMGSIAKAGIAVAKKVGIPYDTMTHFGFYNYRKDKNVEELHEQWRKIIKEAGN